MTEPLLRLTALYVHFGKKTAAGNVKAVDGVSLAVARGETLGLVGESGSGKSTLGLAALRLLEVTRGTVHFDGVDLRTQGPRELRKLRRRMQPIFQDPAAALNPQMRVKEILAEPWVVHGLGTWRDHEREVRALLEQTGLGPEVMERYPEEFSGGQRQRIGIARALALEPALVVADEPVSALDVSVQAQIINLLVDLQRQRGLAYLFIAHDLHVVAHIADRVAVMYRGRIVELGPARAVLEKPQHPYTQLLVASVPSVVPGVRSTPPALRDSTAEGKGCSFQPCCPYAFDRCQRESPLLYPVARSAEVACFLAHPSSGGCSRTPP